MQRNIYIALVLTAFIFSGAGLGMAVTGGDIVALKNAGVSDQTLTLIVGKKAIETAVFTVDEIVSMKKAGVSEKTLQFLIKEGTARPASEAIVYGGTTRSIRHISPEDVIQLKKNGVSDRVIIAVIEAAGSCDDLEREKAWRMLENMDLWVDSPRGR